METEPFEEMDLDSQVSVVPESPPLFTQDQDEEEISEYDDNNYASPNPPGTRRSFQNTGSKSCDVVIDIDDDSAGEIMEVTEPEPSNENSNFSSNSNSKQTTTGVPDLADLIDESSCPNTEDLEAAAMAEALEQEYYANLNPKQGPSTNKSFGVHNLHNLKSDEVRKEEFDKMKRFGHSIKMYPNVRPSSFHTVGFYVTVSSKNSLFHFYYAYL